MEIDQAVHRSLAVSLPSMPEAEMREALACLSFCVPSYTQAVSSSRMSPSPSAFEPTNQQGVAESPLRAYGSRIKDSPLRPGGADQAVTPGSFEEYRDLVVQKRCVEDCSAQMELIRTGASFPCVPS